MSAKDPRKLVIPVKAWSPSALDSYEKCPRQFQFERLQKLCTQCFKGKLGKDRLTGKQRCDGCSKLLEESEHLAFGSQVHTELENYVRGLGPATDNMKGPPLKKRLNKLRADYKLRKVRVELELAFTKLWTLTQWFASDVYVRFKLDVVHFVNAKLTEITDWKTGRYKPDGEYNDQLNSYSTAVLAAGFGEETKARLVFTPNGEVVERADAGILTRKELPRAIKEWDVKASPLFKDKRFDPKPSTLCKWCPYSANKGGPCEH